MRLYFILVLLLLVACTPSIVSDEKITFNVIVPKNTPSSDTIYWHGPSSYKMSKVNDTFWTVSFNKSDLPNLVQYRYTRNNGGFDSAEFLINDSNEFFWFERGRTIILDNLTIRNDVVSRWRWFDNSTTITRSNLIVSPKALPAGFISGQVIEDLYNPSFDNSFNSTAEHMKSVGYNTVIVAPPLQLVDHGEYLSIENNLSNPNYPSDEKLIEEITAYKNQGLNVILNPQLCCEKISYANRSYSWWSSYYQSLDYFYSHYAKVADSANVSAIYFSVNSEDFREDNPFSPKEEWVRIITHMRTNFSGNIGELVWSFDNYSVIPSPEQIAWGNNVDFFVFNAILPLSLSDSPSDQELVIGARKILDGAKPFYTMYNKPVYVLSAYFAVNNSWKGSSFYNIDSVGWTSNPENTPKLNGYSLSDTDQARVINAFFIAIEEREWINGYFQFGYSHSNYPLFPGLSIRDKEAELVWKSWNKEVNQ